MGCFHALRRAANSLAGTFRVISRFSASMTMRSPFFTSTPSAAEIAAIPVENAIAVSAPSARASACSSMPRFGHMGILDETKMKHLMALLLDPASPVNK